MMEIKTEIKDNCTILCGNSRDVLKELPSESVQMIVTSSPYYGLRNYGSDPVIWDGDPTCQHVWEEVHPPGYRKSDTNPGPLQHEGNKNRENLTSQFCNKCGAWKGELGLEPTPELFIKHLTEIFREARRVLHRTGIAWINIGDSYVSNPGNRAKVGGFQKTDDPERIDAESTTSMNKHGLGFKPKDLMEIPSMLAASLRADGWYLRSRLPWIKRNSLPSSVTDRPSSSIEYVFLLSKSQRYYYDYISAMQLSSESYNKDKRPRGVIRQCVNENSKYPDEGQFKKQDGTGNPTVTGFNARYVDKNPGLRFMRDSDFFFKTFQGILHNEDGEPMALIVNPKGYKGAHFACFPVKLIEPMVVAGTSEKGICPECGMSVERFPRWMKKEYQWHQICKCDQPPVPATILDPFNGSGAAGVAALLHGRKYIGIDIKPEYCELAKERILKEVYGETERTPAEAEPERKDPESVRGGEPEPAQARPVEIPVRTEQRPDEKAFDERWHIPRRT